MSSSEVGLKVILRFNDSVGELRAVLREQP